ncbi:MULTISPECIES: TetR/AcrR family transcriptional regulator [unclassified Janthinobacterium]|uniref:TetR/AcrR family transcriptional regulator n=1 Tax=unclassified Janthinobacterium TaxID=2610881 RepID=UPI0016209313|nr:MULTISPECIES: TetR/AcrR family transcriptional regulator [unclassified Janthinobacterium]MBB5371297.1 AcrR family transcriptional regulator [Janthinobacterium sp. K2C7]MBB5384103.1 AcrR family transcriptional regulator [Janthinobacterium sp. K2Li3]MBB5389437.1 AcrR family transcriptional regulator [Janthinobacterium sp. K2E3]
MARPKSEERRAAIMAAASRVIASQGLSAPTAVIAKEAGVSNGSLFTYFETKTALLNALYLELKVDLSAAALKGLPVDRDIRSQMLQLWRNWLRWTASAPEKRRALAQLGVSDEITAQTRQAGMEATAGMAAFIERSRQQGPLRDAPLGFVGAMLSSIADATVDFMIADPANAEQHGMTGFEAAWRLLS